MPINEILLALIIVVIAYLLGSLPMGYILLKMFKGQDITQIGSGRTGGTNAMRAGGTWIGVFTGLGDFAKGFVAVSIAVWLLPNAYWVHALAGFAVVLGHNWSVWLKLWANKLSAGAGTGPNVGAAAVFWPPVILVALPIILIFIFIVGYASLASIAVAVAIVLSMVYCTIALGMPIEYVVFSILTTLIIIWALRPNIKRLVEGNERRVGFFAK